jgi:hypothetical protein
MDKEKELFWEIINFELGETLEYLKDEKSVWKNLSSENRKLILAVVNYCNCDFVMVMRDVNTDEPYCAECGKLIKQLL